MNSTEFYQAKEKQAMQKRYGYWILSALMAAFFVLRLSAVSYAQIYQHYPDIELRGNFNDPNKTDAVLIPQPAAGGARYFLVPVFFSNEADPQYNPNYPGYYINPIRSFEFQFVYDAEAVSLDTASLHGPAVTTYGPGVLGDSTPTSAEHWYIQYTDVPAPLDSNNANPNKHIVRIAAAGEIPLPLITIGSVARPQEYHPSKIPGTNDTVGVLLYLRFSVNQGSPVNASIMYLDSARFNDQIGDIVVPFTSPGVPVVSGINNNGNIGNEANSPNAKIIATLTDQPGFDFNPRSEISTQDDKNWTLNTQLVYDPTLSGASNPQVTLQISDAVGNTQLHNVYACTDEPWLDVSTVQFNNTPSHCTFIPLIDYSSSAGSQEDDLVISADPSGLQPGVYYGYVTLTSDGAYNSPSRILVTLIVERRPDEPTPNAGTGIHLTLTNSCAPNCSTTIVFGTGPGATAGIDPIYGETIFTVNDAINDDTNHICYAYFQPLDYSVDPEFQDPNFLGTLRDIRSDVTNGSTTLLYKVRFNSGQGATNCYPVTVCVDPGDFPAGARIIARDTLNGSIFSFDLRNITQVTTNENCFVIRDPSIQSFIIEYTPGTVGNLPSLITDGWNLISLPVIPPNMSSGAIFPNAASEPYEFNSAAGWTNPPNGLLQFGRGYMIRYGSYIGKDNIVTGILPNPEQISGNSVQLDQGWNSVGGLGVTTGVCGISFLPLPNSTTNPNLVSDVFDYVTGHGYAQVAFLIPGKGYFLKTDSGGYYNLNVSSCKEGATPSELLMQQLAKVNVRDAAMNGQDLFFGSSETTMNPSHFELPPAQFSMDARFASNSGYIEFNRSTYTVAIQTKNYPVSLDFSNLTSDVQVTDMNGNLLGTAINGGTVVINDPNIKSVNISPKSTSIASVTATGYALEQNYPNPFTPSTSIYYTVPVASHVSLVVYNELGQVVQTLVDGSVGAGRHSATFDATNLPSGNYVYTMTAGSFKQSYKMTLSK